MNGLGTQFVLIKKFDQLSLVGKAVMTSLVGWCLALSISIIYCVYYTRYVNLEPRGLLESIVWFFQEYGVWFILTPLLLIALSCFGRERRFGWFWFCAVSSFFISLSFRLALDFYLNPEAIFLTGLVYFMPDHIFITIIVVMGWALVFRQSHSQEVSRVESEFSPTSKDESPEPLSETLEAFKGNKKVIISIANIQLASAAGNYVELQSADGQYLLRSTMKELEEQLKPFHFIRVHRSHLVNPAAIQSVQTDSLVLSCGVELSVSQRYRKNLDNFQRFQ